ncbi:hypothetical protein [Campylobacter sputorum]|uniref:hypothetical protein n=1 Tax=Campylobacter sputorum TaxID=206 RepID=UPI001E334FF0|nr:hypothetical protein [Campylobacter sputorum]
MIKKIANSTFIYIVLFLYVYGIQYIFIPFSTRALLGIFGFFIFFLYFFKIKKKFMVNKDLLTVFIFLLFISLSSFASMTYNNTNDIEFVRYSISMIVNMFASYFFIKILKKLDYKLNFKTISTLLINIILIQVLIALIMFIYPDLTVFLFSIEKMSEETFDRNIYLSGIRFMGIGAAKTFTSGIINGFGLILIAILLRLYKTSSKEIILLSIKFLVIFSLGMMMARTTLIGAILALVIILLPENFNYSISLIKKRTLFFITLTCVTIISLFFIIIFYSDFLLVFQYGFEIFINYFKTSTFETASTNELKEMFIFPNEIKSWIIGDAYWYNPLKGNFYYMNTDVGYSRLIFYFGLIGLFFYFSLQFFLVKAYKHFDVKFKYYIFIIIYLLILNLKGFADLFWLNIIFFMAYILNKNNLNKKLINSNSIK